MEPQAHNITELIELIVDCYESDYNGFKTSFDAAIKNVQLIPPDIDESVRYDWRGKNIKDFCRFFIDWNNFLPHVETGLEYIEKFSWLYYENQAGLDFVTQGPGLEITKQFVVVRAMYMDDPKSKPLIKIWEDELGPKIMDDFIIPPGGFDNFNQFFIREVKDDRRPVSSKTDNSVVVAPADCVINMIKDDLTIDSQFNIKTQHLTLNELLAGSQYASKFVGGTAVSCILMPNTYHRYHSPVAGKVVESNENVVGEYFGIQDFPDLLNHGDVGYGYNYSVFEHFRRGYLIIETTGYGYVGMIPVGLNTISSVIFQKGLKNIPEKDKPVDVEKGQEIGWFQYGGSLNILLFQKGRFPSLRIPQGQIIGTLND